MQYERPKFYYKNNKRILKFNNYKVIEKSPNYFGIYRNGNLISSRSNFKNASKIAKLLEESFIEGYNYNSEY